MLDAIGEIIWAINPQHDRLDRLTAYLREHAARTLESAGLHAHLAFLPHVPDRPVTAEFRRNVFLVLKEALHNVIRHADARSVAVHLSLEEEVLLLVVEDDGRGFPDGNGSPMPESGRGGNGLGNMVHRAEEIGGTLDLDAASGDGTRLTLRAPLSPLHAIDAPPAARDV
jgi:signal transduction histidine kinase